MLWSTFFTILLQPSQWMETFSTHVFTNQRTSEQTMSVCHYVKLAICSPALEREAKGWLELWETVTWYLSGSGADAGGASSPADAI